MRHSRLGDGRNPCTRCSARSRVDSTSQAPRPQMLHRRWIRFLSNVRDGLVRRALRSDRSRLDQPSSLNVASDVTALGRAEDGVLAERIQCVCSADRDRHYPSGTSKTIRQQCSRFRRVRQMKHRVAGTFTLDEIEKTVRRRSRGRSLSGTRPRAASGAAGFGQAYAGDRLKQQLDDLQREFVSEETMIRSIGEPTWCRDAHRELAQRGHRGVRPGATGCVGPAVAGRARHRGVRDADDHSRSRRGLQKNNSR